MVTLRFVPLAVFWLMTACASTSGPGVPEVPEGDDDTTGLPTHWSSDVTATAGWRADASIDGPAGEVSAASWAVDGAANGPLGWIGSLGYVLAAHERVRYDFDDAPLGGDPFDDVHRTSLIGVLFQGVHADGWGVVLMGGLDFAAEVGADPAAGRTWTAGFGVARIPFDDLVVIVGAVVSEPPESEPVLIPGAQLLWTIQEDWQLNVVGTAAELVWTFADDWRTALVAAYTGARTRLDDDTVAYFQDTRLEVGVEFGWSPAPTVEIAAGFGLEVAREITFRDRDGHRIPGGERDVDPTPAFALTATVRF